MQPRDLFNVIIKIFGLFIIKDLFTNLIYLISPLLYIINGDNYKEQLPTLIFSLIILGVYIFIAFMLLFRTSSVLNLLKLENEFLEESLALDISTQNITIIGLIVLGGYILIDEIPKFCNYAFNYYLQSQIKFSPVKPSISNMLISGTKIFIAFLIVGERKQIIQLILKDQTPKHEE